MAALSVVPDHGWLNYLNFLIAAAYVFILCAAAVSDFRRLRIPNWTSVALFLLFFAYAALPGKEFNVVHHFSVAVIVFLVGLLLYYMGVFSAGDVKLMAAVALWAGPTDILSLVLITAVVGGLLGIAVIILRKAPPLILFGRMISLDRVLPRWAKHGLVPYGIAIVGGALWLIRIRF
jgi:prepilin peptidase CpaA